MLDSLLTKIKNLIPAPIFRFFSPAYHWTLAFVAALVYWFPSRKIKVIAVTGTKGKSTTTEIINAILEEGGYRTAVSNTIRFRIAGESRNNLHKMSMPGRFFMQRFLRHAVRAKCDFAVIEMTSQGAITYRHKFISLDCLVLTNISPEHIEAHGSYERYVEAKLAIARSLSRSSKRPRRVIVNGDDKESSRFLGIEAEEKVTYALKDAEPYKIGATASGEAISRPMNSGGIGFTYAGRAAHSPLSGLFNLYNILGAAAAAKSFGVPEDAIIRAIGRFSGVRGRVERVQVGQDFDVIVDYAHTPDSLEKLYQVFENQRTICVLGGTGGGRDTWKRKEMGRIADAYCEEIILTDEDPYDEDPKNIVADVAAGMSDKEPDIIMDRRLAIREAISRAKTGDAVLITGKGTDPYIMGPNGTKTPWDDAQIAREELGKISKVVPR